MRFNIEYECRAGGQVFRDSFEFESNWTPGKTDYNVIEAAMRASVKFLKEGAAGVEVLGITQGSE